MRGRKPLLIFLIVPLLFLFYSCGGGGSGSSYSPPADKPGLPYSLSLLPSQGIAQTNSSIILNAKVLDGNGVPVPNVVVTFTNLSEPFGVLRGALRALGLVKPIGELSATLANTNSIGIATVSITSTTVGFATIQAEISNSVGISRTKKTLFFALDVTPQAPPPPTLKLHVDDGKEVPPIFDQPDDFILLKGANDNQRTIRADVLDGFGSPPPIGTDVTFGADLPYRIGGDPAAPCSDGSTTCSVTFPNGNTAKTDSHGQAFTLLQVNASTISNLGTVLNITASATVDNQSAFDLISLFLSPVNVVGPPGSNLSYLSAVPTTIDTTQTSKVTAVVFLSTGAPAPDGTSVNFSVAPKTGSDPSPCGSIDPFEQTTGGVTAPATFTPPLTPGVCTVTGKVGGVIIGTVNITVTVPPIVLAVVPSTQTINGVTGGTATFTIFGGRSPYTVSSSNVAFPPSTGTVSASGDTFTVTVPANTPTTTVTYTIRDSAGTTVTATLNIAGVALAVQPTAETVDGVAGGTATFTIFGGRSPYTVSSSNVAFPPSTGTVSASGDTFTVTVPANTPTTTVTYTIRDSAGATVTATLNIAGVALAVFPSAPAVHVGTTVSFTIFGGAPPYNAFTSDVVNGPILPVNPLPSNTFTVGPILAAICTPDLGPPVVPCTSTIGITVRDSKGTTKDVTINVTNP